MKPVTEGSARILIAIAVAANIALGLSLSRQLKADDAGCMGSQSPTCYCDGMELCQIWNSGGDTCKKDGDCRVN